MLGAAVAMLALGATAGALALSEDQQLVRGTYTLFSADDVVGSPDDCEGTGGYDDVSAGVPVTVRNQNDDVVGSATLENGSLRELAERVAANDDIPVAEARELVADGEGLLCMLVFDVEVDDADFYVIEVGDRGDLSYSRAQMSEKEWRVAFSLGT